MGQSMKDQVVLVTGAGRGIGRAIALLAAAEGAAVVVNDLGVAPDGRPEAASSPADEVVAEIRATGGRAVANGGNICDADAANAMVRQAIGEFGRLDAVVNNAGFLRDAIFHKMKLEDWQAVQDVHLTGYFNVSRAAAEHFRETGSGRFVHFSSGSGVIGNVGQANYQAAKMGVVGLSKAIALDMQRFGVRSNVIVPFAWSRLVGTVPTEKEEDRRRIDRMRAMTPEKVAPLVVFLCSELSAGVTGQIFGSRQNEMFLFSQPRPIRSVHRAEGWTPDTLAEQMLPAMKASFYPLDRSADVFSWDPI